jgi:hypothetical protein
MSAIKKLDSDPNISRRLLIAAQILALIAYALGLQFLLNSTGGTVFVFSTIGPVLVGICFLILIGVTIHRFLRSHSLFSYEIYQPGDIVFQQGDQGDCAYFIHSGEVEVVQMENDKEKVVAVLKDGQYFGEMALITSHPRNATVRAVNATKLAVLGKKNFLTMLNLMPSARKDIMLTVTERAMKHAASQ